MSKLTAAMLAVLAAPHSAPAQQPAERAWADAACHLAFQHPADWIVAPDTSFGGEACTFVVRPVHWDSLMAVERIDWYTIAVRVMPIGFDSALSDSPFERRGDAWVVLGRQGMESDAREVAGRGWRGVRGVATVGCFAPEGYAGLCDAPTALLGTDARSVLIQGGPASEDAVELILSSLELRP